MKYLLGQFSLQIILKTSKYTLTDKLGRVGRLEM